MKLQEHVALAPYTTFRMGGQAALFADIASAEELEEFSREATKRDLQLLIIGGGSNIVFPDQGELKAAVGRMAVKGIEVEAEDESGATLAVGAGEVWDDVVQFAVERGLAGIEALSAIPGSAGATPVQNVGAYGSEIADALIKLEAYDLASSQTVAIQKGECGFAYRDSKFKHEWKGKYVITSVTLRLSKKLPLMPAYAGVEAYFEKRGVAKPTLAQIRAGIIEIRKYKLPDPREIASCGSFFKNPIISKKDAEKLRGRYPDAVLYPLEEERVKVAAGWMLDTLGLKGARFGGIEVYRNNALVLTNTGGATRGDVEEAIASIKKGVKEAFGVDIEPEAVLIA